MDLATAVTYGCKSLSLIKSICLRFERRISCLNFALLTLKTLSSHPKPLCSWANLVCSHDVHFVQMTAKTAPFVIKFLLELLCCRDPYCQIRCSWTPASIPNMGKDRKGVISSLVYATWSLLSLGLLGIYFHLKKISNYFNISKIPWTSVNWS